MGGERENEQCEHNGGERQTDTQTQREREREKRVRDKQTDT